MFSIKEPILLNKINQYFHQNISNQALIIFRIGYGFLLVAEAWGAILTGWVKRVFIDTPYNFHFIGFDFLDLLHGPEMYLYYFIMGCAGIGVMIGFKYRTSIILYSLMWAGVYFAQKSSYNNHYYFMMILNSIMIIAPANQNFSWDTLKGKITPKTKMPRWVWILFIAAISLVYFFGSLAKCNLDWIQLKQLSMWFEAKEDYFLIGPILQFKWFQYIIAYGGILFDGLIVPFLLWKKTRKWAFIVSLFFHLFNSAVFQVGVFPYMGIFYTVWFFYDVDFRLISKNKWYLNQIGSNWNFNGPKLITFIIIFFIAWQTYLPLRHILYKGPVYWTEEGHRLAWQMMARSKRSSLTFTVVNHQTSQKIRVSPLKSVSKKQYRAMSSRPDMIWQYTQKLKQQYRDKGWSNISIYANSYASLNGRPMQRFIKKDLDFASIDQWPRFTSKPWFEPLQDWPQ